MLRTYANLKFNGEFKVRIHNEAGFKLWHHGGNIENETFWNGLFVTWANDTGWIWKELCQFYYRAANRFSGRINIDVNAIYVMRHVYCSQ